MNRVSKTGFAVLQYYEIIIDETRMDGERMHWSQEDAEGIRYVEEHFTKLHRILQSLISHPKSLHAILEYHILCECDSNGEEYRVQAHYGLTDEEWHSFGLPEALMRVADCFCEEDKQWLTTIIKDRVVAHAEMRDGYNMEELSTCFTIHHLGWDIQAHDHRAD